MDNTFDMSKNILDYLQIDTKDDSYGKHLTEENIVARAELCKRLVSIFEEYLTNPTEQHLKIRETLMNAVQSGIIFKADAHRICFGLQELNYMTINGFAQDVAHNLLIIYLPLNKQRCAEDITFQEILNNQEF